KNFVNSNGLEDIVRFHGRLPRNEVDTWYGSSHAFLFPSYREPSGNVVFEALSHALPVLTCKAGGPGHVINDTCGLIIDISQPRVFSHNLAKGIEYLYRNPDAYSKKSESAIERIKEIGSWETKLSQLFNLYESTYIGHQN